MLEIRDLICGYGTVTALKGLSLKVEEGQLVALVGANGAGKSTTLRAVSGLIPVRSGSIHFAGRDITGTDPRKVLAQGIAHCPEGRRVFPQMSVAENRAMGAYLRRDPAGVSPTSRGSTMSSRALPSVATRRPALCRAASSRCWRLAAR